MKRFVKVMLCFAMVSLALSGCGGRSYTHTLRVFNWGEYVDPDVINGFQREFDCKVVYETFDSNESMYTKLLGGNKYDIMVPSEYMIERLIKENLLQKIDWSLITNKSSIDSKVLNQNFDKANEYWVPYFYGNVGIVYDKTQVSENDLNMGWEVLRNPKYKGNIYMYDSERDSFMVALKALGYSMNTTNQNEIEEAYQWLIEQRKTMDPTYAADDTIDAMKSSEKAMAVMYSGDAAAVMLENPDIGFYMPEEGTNVWFDGFVVSKECENLELAMNFINYMISDENALNNTLEVGYLTSNTVAAKEASEGDFQGINAYGIRMDQNDEVFAYQTQDVKEMYSDFWSKVKAQ
ncbi:ABC transporter substrate-binding protein [Candidatus Stoquefichus massiliensis]|uniref:ABC transporter substrate-binding protein n=1 Tax=Candidatus Stoquefichus massiliensis TaxID=1470350 RepID=UPI0004867EE0|nr:ABC transporter substrate-binding protein [Candidatus Stoquefichus massiliensis]